MLCIANVWLLTFRHIIKGYSYGNELLPRRASSWLDFGYYSMYVLV